MSVITQDQYSIVKQKYRNILIKINLLNFNFQVVDSIEGNLISGNVVVDANSDIRRTCNITMVIKNHEFKIETGGQIWLDKYIQIFYGIKKNSTQEVIYTNMGIFLINNPNHVYDAVNNTLTFQGLDLMAKLTGIRNGYFEWLNGLIEQGTEIRSLFIDLLQQAGFNKYNIEDLVDSQGNQLTLPYEIEVSSTSTLYGVFNEIRNNVMPNYEMFFDIDGVFILKRIYNSASDPIIIDNDIWDKTILNISNDIDFENVKNVIEIWGQLLDPTYGNPICELTNQNIYVNGYECSIISLNQNNIIDKTYIVFGINSVNQTNKPYLKINNFVPHPITKNGSFNIFTSPTTTDYYTVVYNNTTSFDSQTGVFNVVGDQDSIPTCLIFNQTTPKVISGYSCEIPNVSLNNNTIVIGVDVINSTNKPYLKINNLEPHPIVKNGKFFKFSQSEDSYNNFYLLSYNSTTSFDSQTGVFNVVGSQNSTPICSSNYHSLLKANGYECEILSLNDFQQIPSLSLIGFGIKNINSTNKPYLKINNFEPHPIIQNNKFVDFSILKKDDIDYYAVTYDDNVEFDSQVGVYNFIGYQQIHYVIKDEIPESPFNIHGTIGEILLPLSGGEYDNIQTYEQAKDRAEWELYNYDRMNDRIRLTSVVIPWIDVNQKIQYINEDAEISGIFIIKSVSMDLAVEGTMTMECIRWYDYDPSIA